MSGDVSTPAVPVTDSTPSGPPSTSDIAATVIAEAEAGESAHADATPEGQPVELPTPEPSPDPTPAVIEPPLSEEEQLLHEFGFKQAKKPDGRDHYIPRPKVLSMIASGLKRGKEKWTAEKGTLEQQVTQYKADLDELYSDVRGEPKAFLEKIAGVDPRYKVFLAPPAATPAPPPPQALNLPDPDVPLPDGSRTYSLEAFQKSLIPFIVQQARAEAKAEATEALKPITEREQRAAYERQQQEGYRAQMADLQKLPRFGQLPADGSLTPFQQEVLTVLKQDSEKLKTNPRHRLMTLKEAYYEAERPYVSTDRNKIREEVIKELNAANKSTPTLARTGVETKRTPGPLSTAEIAARVISNLEREG